MHPIAAKRASIVIIPFLTILLACGGGGGGGNGGTNGGATTIEGRVESVSSTTSAIGGGAGAGTLAGIRVEATQAGQTLDVTTTDIEGRFTLEFVTAGRIDLLFVTDGATLTLGLDVVPGTVVTLVVELRIDEDEVVIVDDGSVDELPIRCETGSPSISDGDLDLIIDGQGDDCIRAAGNCRLDIRVHSLTLVDCERCIDAEGGSDVHVTTDPGSFVCESSDDGIRAGGNASVVIDALAGVEIDSSDGNGIRTDGVAQVAVGSAGVCHIDGGEDSTRENGASVIDLGACFVVDPGDRGVPGDDDDDFGGDDDD